MAALKGRVQMLVSIASGGLIIVPQDLSFVVLGSSIRPREGHQGVQHCRAVEGTRCLCWWWLVRAFSKVRLHGCDFQCVAAWVAHLSVLLVYTAVAPPGWLSLQLLGVPAAACVSSISQCHGVPSRP